MRIDQEILQRLASALEERGTLADSARMIGVSRSTVFSWIAQSQNNPDDPRFLVTFAGESVPLFEAVQGIRRLHAFQVVDSLEYRALHGYYEPVITTKGTQAYKEDPKLVGMTDEEIKALGYQHRYLVDENGEPVPLMRWHPPSDKLALAVAAVHFRNYRNRIDEQDAPRTGGVLVVDSAPQQLEPPSQPIAEEEEEPTAVESQPSAPERRESGVIDDVAQPAPMAAKPLTEAERAALERLARPAPSQPAPRSETEYWSSLDEDSRPRRPDKDPRARLMVR